MNDNKERPVSPVNGVPLPEGRKFTAGEVAREAGSKGGKRAAETKRMRKTLRQELIDILTTMEVTDKQTGNKMPIQEAMSAKLIEQVMKGNVRAFEIIRDTIGEKPTDNISIVQSDYTALEQAYEAMKGDSQ